MHGSVLALLLVWTFFTPRPKEQQIELIILPKGTSLDAVLTKEVEEAMKNPSIAREATPVKASPTPEPPKPDKREDEVLPPAAEPSPTPIKLVTPTPVITPAPTAEPNNVVEVAPKGTPKPTATPTPAPTKSPTPKPSTTPKTAKASPTPNAKKTPNANAGHESAKATPKSARKTPKPTPIVVASAYEIKNNIDGSALPGQTPSNVKVGEAKPGQEIGVPGIAEGVEGAPLPLDRNQSMLSMLYTTRARMRIQANFTVPPGVNDPNLTCVVEWEILTDGTIRNARVTKSTGTAQYDSLALEAIQKTTNLGPLPPEFQSRQSIWTSLTFVFAGDQ